MGRCEKISPNVDRVFLFRTKRALSSREILSVQPRKPLETISRMISIISVSFPADISARSILERRPSGLSLSPALSAQTISLPARSVCRTRFRGVINPRLINQRPFLAGTF